ncbi:MAG: PGF-pre-PGF domain-containing protein, partial [Candidatus Methanoperedens sp.]|nr:PGF-pre-PGF domain-containing protein [Candidatus Methanoperedens sp.]
TNITSATFTFSSSEDSSTFECQLDNGGYTDCTSSKTYNSLSDGTHIFEVQATDGAGNIDSTPASQTWTVDTSAPDTTIYSNPPFLTNITSATFTFSGTEAVFYECKLDGGAYGPCTSPQDYSGLGEGFHTFNVSGIDGANNVDLIPATYGWTIDTTPPGTKINSNPPFLTNITSATFTFSGTEAVFYECKLDGRAYESCTSPQDYSGLGEGSHTFNVIGIDGADNVDPIPATYGWTIDTPPDWLPTPQNQIVQVGVSFSYDVSATDASNITYSIDDSTNFTINSESGRITNKIRLNVGSYSLNITAIDTDAPANSVSQIITITVQAEPTYSVNGYVFDNNNARLESVNIQNGTNQATSNATGYYLIRGLLNGSYNFSYSRSGFYTNYSMITISGSDVTIANMTLVGIPAIAPSPSSGGGGGSSGGGGGGGTSGENFLNIIVKEKYDLFIYKDIVTSYRFKNISNPILSINIVGNVNAGEIPTAVEVLRNTSSLVKSPAPGNVYKNVNIWVGTSGFGTSKNIKQAVITFRLPNSWLSSNNMKSSGIKMVRWDGSKWDQVETSEITKDSTYIYFEAKTNSFSSIAITGMENKEYVTETAYMREPLESAKPAAAIQPEEKKSDFLTNWFIIIGVFFAIGLVIEMYLRAKKK